MSLEESIRTISFGIGFGAGIVLSVNILEYGNALEWYNEHPTMPEQYLQKERENRKKSPLHFFLYYISCPGREIAYRSNKSRS